MIKAHLWSADSELGTLINTYLGLPLATNHFSSGENEGSQHYIIGQGNPTNTLKGLAPRSVWPQTCELHHSGKQFKYSFQRSENSS